jgi:DNA-binding Lrp family transcriptional regulator
MVHAYVLIHTVTDEAASVARALREIEGVVSAEDLSAPYDVIARVSAADLDDLGRLLVHRIQAIPGVLRTTTCVVVDLSAA